MPGILRLLSALPALEVLRGKQRKIVPVEEERHDPFLLRRIPDHFGVAIIRRDVESTGLFSYLRQVRPRSRL